MVRIPIVNCCEDCCFLESVNISRNEKVYRCNKSKKYAEVLSDLYETCQLPDIRGIAKIASCMIGDKNKKDLVEKDNIIKALNRIIDMYVPKDEHDFVAEVINDAMKEKK